jgi:hypothetical protein
VRGNARRLKKRGLERGSKGKRGPIQIYKNPRKPLKTFKNL